MLNKQNSLVKFGKLLKYDLFSCARFFIPVYITLILISFIVGFSLVYDNENFAPKYDFGVILVIVYLVFFGFTCISTFIYGINRFKKNLLSNEGYLSFSLPVGISNHILSKLVNCLIWCFIGIIVGFLSVLALSCTSGTLIDLINDVFEALGKNKSKILGELIYYIFYLITSLSVLTLTFFAMFSIGQLVEKRRMFFELGFLILLLILCSIFEKYVDLQEFSILNIVIQIILGIGLYLISYFSLTKRLNLE